MFVSFSQNNQRTSLSKVAFSGSGYTRAQMLTRLMTEKVQTLMEKKSLLKVVELLDVSKKEGCRQGLYTSWSPISGRFQTRLYFNVEDALLKMIQDESVPIEDVRALDKKFQDRAYKYYTPSSYIFEAINIRLKRII